MQDEFRKTFIENAKRRGSKLILALDCNEWGKAEKILKETSSNIATVKIHPEHAGLWGFEHTELVRKVKELTDGAPIILDAKLADIDINNAMKARFYLSKGYDAIIAHGFPGEKAVEATVSVGNEMKKGVFLLTAMSSPGHMFKNDIVEKLAGIAKKLNVAGVIAPGNQYELLSLVRKRVGNELLILSPGIGAQGGEAEKAIKAGANFAIIGRSIINSENPAKTTLEMKELMNKPVH
jgi:orotidine-5'-phosphate decarboxylase